MKDENRTLTSPLSGPNIEGGPLLALTILWHPNPDRIGEQHVTGGRGTIVEMSRFRPLFCRPASEGLALGHGGISREPLRITRNALDDVTLHLPASRMTVELNGGVIEGELRLTAAQIETGQILTLGRAVLLCLHWMTSLPKHNSAPGLAGVGSAAVTMRDQIRMVAPTDVPVLLLGETGTGKEIAARAIHALGKQSAARLVTVNMAALNEALAPADLFGAAKGAYTGAQAERRGIFGEADGATLFLDEIGNAPATVQPMLLRVLEGGDYRPLGASQDRHSTARLIAATNQDVDAAEFNQALLRRLEGFAISLPPLRNRREDIGVLILHLIGDKERAGRMSCALVGQLSCYHWPGNIRELACVLQRAMLMLDAGVIPLFEQLVRVAAPAATVTCSEISTLPQTTRRKPNQLSEQEIVDAMVEHGWNIHHAALALKISRPSLYKLLKQHPNIKRP